MDSSKVVPVSVVIPCFNCARTIQRALESVSTQTLLPEEIIIVDDGSDDSSAEVIAELVEKGKRDWIKVVSLAPNRGVGAARNAGWHRATSTYIAFIDADDAWHPRKIEIQYNWLMLHPSVSICGHVLTEIKEDRRVPESITAAGVNDVSATSLLLSNQYDTSSVMVKRDIPARFKPDMRYCEDYALWLDIVLAGNRAVKLDAVLGYRFKPVYGASGLSAKLWKMEKGELRAYWEAFKSDYISAPTTVLLGCYSLLKFLRRAIIRLFSVGLRARNE